MKDFTILVGGQAGQGSRKAGLVIAKILNNLGYRIFIYDDYESLIKGGHSFSKIRASDKKIFTQSSELNFILALDQKTLDKHLNNLKDDGIIIFNSDEIKFDIGLGINAETICHDGRSPFLFSNSFCINS